LSFDLGGSKPIIVEPSAAQISSDAGLLPFRQLDERIGLTRQFAEALSDRRNVGYIHHSFLEMTRMRVYGILDTWRETGSGNPCPTLGPSSARRPFVDEGSPTMNQVMSVTNPRISG
jgi:hypothetical protein